MTTSKEYLAEFWAKRQSLPVQEDASPHEQEKQKWDGFWYQRGDELPVWYAYNIPKELTQAVESEWFSAGSKLLDIGCGNGNLSYWLATQGYDVFGFDFADSAITEAKANYDEQLAKLEFQTLDACCLPDPPHLFQALFDRGCFHNIPEEFTAQYVQGLANWAAPEARLLMLTTISIEEYGDLSPQEITDKGQALIQKISEYFEPFFQLTSAQQTTIPLYHPTQSIDPLPALALWMVRSQEI